MRFSSWCMRRAVSSRNEYFDRTEDHNDGRNSGGWWGRVDVGLELFMVCLFSIFSGGRTRRWLFYRVSIRTSSMLEASSSNYPNCRFNLNSPQQLFLWKRHWFSKLCNRIDPPRSNYHYHPRIKAWTYHILLDIVSQVSHQVLCYLETLG